MSTFSIHHVGDVNVRENFVEDLNGGPRWDAETLDPYAADFIDLCRATDKPIAVLGIGNGLTTKKLLETGVPVIANDLQEDRLDKLKRSVSSGEQERLKLMPGDALQLVIPNGSLGGILASKWINVLRPYECRLLMNDFYRWLAPGGVMCITAHTPYSNTTKDAVAVYEHRKYIGDEWPGVVTEDMFVDDRRGKLCNNDWIYGYDPDILAREAILAGFQVKRCSFYGTPYAAVGYTGDEAACNYVGIIARKPDNPGLVAPWVKYLYP